MASWISTGIVRMPGLSLIASWRAPRGLFGEERRREVALAEVGQDRDDQLPRVLGAFGHLDRAGDRGAAGDAAEHALLAGQPARHLEGFLVADDDNFVDDLGVEDVGDEPRADPLDLVR